MTQRHNRPTTITIDHFYLDKEVCSRCTQTGESVAEAARLLRAVLDPVGVEVDIASTRVETAEQAEALRLVASPTVRINGRDLDPDIAEDACAECSDLAGDAINCRVWSWRGDTSRAAPVALIVDGALEAVYGQGELASRGPSPGASAGGFALPENLRRFFAGAPTPGCGCGC